MSTTRRVTAATLTGPPQAHDLASLDLAGNALTSASLNALCTPNVLPKLRHLDIHRNDIAMEAIASFCDQAPHCHPRPLGLTPASPSTWTAASLLTPP
jgi:hypothetical protein